MKKQSEEHSSLNKPLVITIAAIFTILGGVMTLNSGNVSSGEFKEYKEGVEKQDRSLDQRLTRMEEKLDTLVQHLSKK